MEDDDLEFDDTVGKRLGELLADIRDGRFHGPTPAEQPLASTRPVDDREVASLARPAAPRPGVIVRDTWELLELVGTGGFGQVFTARHRTLGRDDALKFLHPHLADDAEVRARFEREALVMARLRGDHLVHVHDYGEHEGLPFFVMEHLQGQSLDERLADGDPVPLLEFYRLAEGILRGLAEIHAHGIVHRDVKPANIFALEGSGRIKMLDFGLAMTSMRVTSKGSIMGTPLYMAPELLLAPDVEASVATDTYSAGVVLYQMLTGRVPFLPGKDGNLADFLQQVITGIPRPPSAKRPEIPEALDDVVLRAIDKDPSRRPETADEFAEELQRIRVSAASVRVPAAVIGTELRPLSPTFAAARPQRKVRLFPILALSTLGIGIFVGALLLGMSLDDPPHEFEPDERPSLGPDPDDGMGLVVADAPATIGIVSGSSSSTPSGDTQATGSPEPALESVTPSSTPVAAAKQPRRRSSKPKTDVAVVAGLRRKAGARCKTNGTTMVRVEGIISSSGRVISPLINPSHDSGDCLRKLIKAAEFSEGEGMRPMPAFSVKL